MNYDNKPSFEALEERVLLSGSPIENDVAIHVALNDKEEVSSQMITDLLVIDTSVGNYEDLIADVSQPGLEIQFIDSTQNGIEQISAILKTYKNLDSLHIVSHGSGMSLSLGSVSLDTESLENNKNLISGWSKAFTADADILIYGCDLASSETGQNVVDRLAELTGADIAASNDITGFGGDVELEVNTGSIEANVLIYQETFDKAGVSLLDVTVDSSVNTAALLQAKITEAGAGGKIVFTEDTTVNFESTLSISSEITIEVMSGKAVTFDGGGARRLFAVTSGTVTFDGVTFQNASDPNGGAIEASGDSTLNIYNSVFKNNSAVGGAGGAIRVVDTADLNVDSSSFESNTAAAGGAIAGAASGGVSIITITNSTFHQNTAIGWRGGAIFTYHNVKIDINNSTFSENSSNSGAGAIYKNAGYTSESLLINNSTFYNNSSTSNSQMIGLNQGATANITNSTLYGVSAGNSLQANGGSSFTITSSIVSGTASGNVISNGGLLTDGTGYSGTSTVDTVTNIFGSSSPVLANNGGKTQTVILGAGSVALNKGAISGTDQRGYTLTDARDIGAFELGTVNSSPTITAKNFTFTRGGETVITEAMLNATDAETASARDLRFILSALSNVQFTLNGQNTTTFTLQDIKNGLVKASHNMWEGAPAFKITVSDTDNNTVLSSAAVDAVVAAFTSATIDVTSYTFTQFKSLAENGVGGDTLRFTGGTTVDFTDVITLDHNITIENTSVAVVTFDATVADKRHFLINNNADVTLKGLTLINALHTSAGFNGGSISAEVGTTLTIENSIFRNNQAVVLGGAIYTEGKLFVTDSTFDSNKLNNNNASIGSAISLINSGTAGSKIEGSTFKNNDSQASGSGAWWSGTGVIYINQVGANALILERSTFSGNTYKTGAEGGAIVSVASNIEVNNVTISGEDGFKSINSIDGDATVSHSIIDGHLAAQKQSVKVGTITAEYSFHTGDYLVGNTETVLPGIDNQKVDLADLKLQTLANNGGLTETIALGVDSVAINAGKAAAGETDQRGKAISGTRDIGAYEDQQYDGTVSVSAPEGFNYNKTLTASESGTDAEGENAGAYQWQISSTGADDSFTDIAGANTANYTIDPSHTGQFIRVVYIYTEDNGTSRSVASSSNQVFEPSLITLSTDSFTELEDAIEAVADGGTIRYNSSSNLIISFARTLTLNKGVTIENTGTGKLTFDGNNSVGHFVHTSGIITLENLTIIRGNAVDGVLNDGGSIYSNASSGSKLIIIDTTFANNSTPGGKQGGAIALLGSADLTVTNSTFDSNFGAAIGAAISINQASGSVLVENSTFFNNTNGNPWFSAGVGSKDHSGNLTINNSTFYSSDAANLHALHIGNNTGKVTANSNIFVGALLQWGESVTEAEQIQGFNNITTSSVQLYIANANPTTLADQSNTNIATTEVALKLGTLADNGGKTQTIALLPGSIAINSSGADAGGIDQRGVAIQGGDDVGSYEAQVPVLTTSAGTTSFTEGDSEVAIDASATLTNPNQDWDGGRLTVQSNGTDSNDVIALPTATNTGINVNGNYLRNGTTVIGSVTTASVTANTLWTLTFNASASNADVLATLQAITFVNSSESPVGGNRTIIFTVSDADSYQSVGTKIISFNSVNDKPVASSLAERISENQSVTVDALAIATDLDTPLLNLTIATGVDAPFIKSVLGSAGLGTGSVSIVDGKIQFDPGTDFDILKNGESATVTVSYKINDNELSNNISNEGTITITINGSNDAAVATSAVENLEVTTNNPTPSVSGKLTHNDVDNDPNVFQAKTETKEYGTLVFNIDGSYTYTANASVISLPTQTVFTDVFTVKTEDGTETTITINLEQPFVPEPLIFDFSGTSQSNFNIQPDTQFIQTLQNVFSNDFLNFVTTESSLDLSVQPSGDFLASIERAFANRPIEDLQEVAENGEGLELEKNFYDTNKLTPAQIQFIESLLEEVKNFEASQNENVDEDDLGASLLPNFNFITELEGQAEVEALPEAITMDELDERKSLDETLNGEFSIFS